jgi:cAMP-dependent protein kinase regulator
MEECTCKAGQQVILAGEPGEWFYVVQSGAYDCLVDGALVHSYRLEEQSESGKHGVSFGELALLYTQQARAASIVCCEDGKLWRLHARTFRDLVVRSSTQSLLKTLRSVEVLRELSLSQLQRLFDALSEIKVQAGGYIFKEGETGSDFFVVMEGEAAVLKKSSGAGGEQEVMQLGQNDYFGERALLNAAPRAASVRATTPMKLLQISKAQFEEVLGPLSEIIDNHRRKREEQGTLALC